MYFIFYLIKSTFQGVFKNVIVAIHLIKQQKLHIFPYIAFVLYLFIISATAEKSDSEINEMLFLKYVALKFNFCNM